MLELHPLNSNINLGSRRIFKSSGPELD